MKRGGCVDDYWKKYAEALDQKVAEEAMRRAALFSLRHPRVRKKLARAKGRARKGVVVHA